MFTAHSPIQTHMKKYLIYDDMYNCIDWASVIYEKVEESIRLSDN